PGKGPAALSEDGTFYAAVDQGDLLISDIKTQKEIQRVKIGSETMERIALSSDGKLAAVATPMSQSILRDIKLIDLSTGKVIHTCQGESRIDFEPGQHALYYVLNNSLMRFDPESGKRTVLARDQLESGIMDLAISPRHDWAALSGYHSNSQA